MDATTKRPPPADRILYCACGRALGVCTDRRLSLGAVAIHESVKLVCECCREAKVWRPTRLVVGVGRT